MFELLRERGQEAAPTGAPDREHESAVPWSGAGVTRAERSAATFEDEPRAHGELRVPMTKVYMAVAVVLVLIVGAWAAGHKLGVAAGKKELERLVRDEPVVTPIQASNQPTQAPVQGNPVQTPTQAQTQPAQNRPQQGPITGPWVLTSDGLRVSEPRTPGTNYLELATLTPAQTTDALAFLASKGVRAVGVPVDSGGSAANNPSRYTLYSLGLAVPSGQFRTTTAERREHQELVARIGGQWKRERQGASDFSQSQTLWRKYEP